MPGISIVILSLMRLPHTRRCIEALYRHTALPIELVIVDMGSNDAVLSYLDMLCSREPNVTVLKNDRNIGTAAGRNQGAAQVNGDWLVFLDNDAEVTHGWLEALLAFDSGVNVGVCVPKLLSSLREVLVAPNSVVDGISRNGNPVIGFRLERSYSAGDAAINQDCVVPWYPTTCLMVRSEIFRRVGGFDENIFLAEEDKDLCLSIRQLGYQIAYAPKAEVHHATLDNSPEYRAIRDNLLVLNKDKCYFEKKWKRKVIMECSRKFLRARGMSDEAITLKKRFDVFTTVIEHGDSFSTAQEVH
ncbi:MAG: GT2 family glycosyltransferase [Alcanivorax sp.]|jgi:GT2 family glycosyltransferase